MFADLKPYSAMRDSGVPWLGDLPDHWDVRRIKEAFVKIAGGATPPTAEASYWDGDVVWVTPADVSRGAHLRTSLRRITESGLKACSTELVPSGSLIVTSRAPVGNVAVAETELCTNQGCKALVATRRVVDPLYGFHVLTTLKDELKSLASGTTFVEISTSRLGDVRVPLPPLVEQAAIVRFLQHADRRIRRYIRAKKKLIILLEEQKQATIQRAVTRGLDPRVRLRPSGVEWLGDIPAHWAVRRVKQAFVKVVGGSTPPSAETSYWDGDIVWVTPADVSRASRLGTSLRRLTVAGLKACSAEIVPTGSLIVTSRAPVGNVAIAETELCTSQGCKALVAAPADLDSVYAFYVFTTLKGELESVATGTTFAEISRSRLGDVRIPHPPRPEQAAITRFVDEVTAAITAVMDGTRRGIEMLREFRTRLIADVVTGKLDVRQAAARLPNEGDEPEVDDEVEAECEEDEAGAHLVPEDDED